MTDALIWLIAIGAIAGILFRPRNWPEATWACAGAVLLIACRLIPLSAAAAAVLKGTDVYLFLTGMMLLADLARREGVFDWLASHAVDASRGSRTRLFLLVYIVGIVVTVFLSNDATAVVPISNPANLVVYGKTLPPLLPWLRSFALPSLVSIVVTYIALRIFFRAPLRGTVEDRTDHTALTTSGRLAVWGIGFTGAVLITASALGLDLGLPTCVASIAALLVATRCRLRAVWEVAREVSWSVLPLVAGLFVLVEAVNVTGASARLIAALRVMGPLAASISVALLSNMMNNLPTGLLAGSALATMHASAPLRDAVLIGVDLGPNLSMTASLATILWLIALRREGHTVSGFTFLRCGIATMPAALLLATLARLYCQWLPQ